MALESDVDCATGTWCEPRTCGVGTVWAFGTSLGFAPMAVSCVDRGSDAGGGGSGAVIPLSGAGCCTAAAGVPYWSFDCPAALNGVKCVSGKRGGKAGFLRPDTSCEGCEELPEGRRGREEAGIPMTLLEAASTLLAWGDGCGRGSAGASCFTTIR
jgi:hypothetical protein